MEYKWIIIEGETSRSGQRLNTKTVYGFLDFTTTVRDTVMIFKPSKAGKKKSKRTPPKNLKKKTSFKENNAV